MIKQSDIVVSVIKNEKIYKSDTIVQAHLEVNGIVSIDREFEGEYRVVERAKENVKWRVWNHIYGDLRDPIEEMYEIAMAKMPYCPELKQIEEAKKRIDEIMRGES